MATFPYIKTGKNRSKHLLVSWWLVVVRITLTTKKEVNIYSEGISYQYNSRKLNTLTHIINPWGFKGDFLVILLRVTTGG